MDGGTPNAKTEALLTKYPFRRASHAFCSPGYCRCHETRLETGFSASAFPAPASDDPDAAGLPVLDASSPDGLDVRIDTRPLLLESSGEGVHVYDLAHRLFESEATANFTVYGLRRRVGGPDDAALAPKAAAFIESIRGSLFSTVQNEFKDSLEFRLSNADAPKTPKPGSPDLESRSHFCSKMLFSFYKEIGLVADDRAAATVMPPDYVARPDHPLAREVVFVPGVELAPLEIVWEKSSHPTLTSLPWRPKRRR